MNQPEDNEGNANRTDKTASPSLQDRVRSLTLGLGASSELQPSSKYAKQREGGDDWYTNALNLLDRCRTVTERQAGAELVATKIRNLSLDELGGLWSATEDAFKEDAPLEVRIVGFTLIISSLRHSRLGLGERSKLFWMTTVPILPSGTEQQIQTLGALTSNGKKLEPFTRPFVMFLCNGLGPQHKATIESRRNAPRPKAGRNRPRLPEEKGLYAFLSLVKHVIFAQSDAIDGEELRSIVEQAIEIAHLAPSTIQMEEALSIINAVISVSHIPDSLLEPCVELLSAISTTIDALKDMAWQSLTELLRTTQCTEVVTILSRNMISTTDGKHMPKAEGALAMILHLILSDGADRLPQIDFSLIYAVLFDTPSASQGATHNCLHTAGYLMEAPRFAAHLFRHRWVSLLALVCRSLGENNLSVRERTPLATLRNMLISDSRYLASGVNNTSIFELPETVEDELRTVAKATVLVWPRLVDEEQAVAMTIFYRMRDILPVEAEDLMAAYISEHDLVLLGTDHWIQALSGLVNRYLLTTSYSVRLRCAVLKVLNDIVSTLKSSNMRLDSSASGFRAVILDLINKLDVKLEDSVEIINRVADFVAIYAQLVDPEDFRRLLGSLWSMLSFTGTASPASDVLSGGSPENTVSVSMVRIFMQSMSVSAEKTSMTFEKLIDVVRAQELPTIVRLPAMKLLTRLRCDLAHVIIVIPNPDSFGLAATIARTEATYVRSSTNQFQGDRSSVNEEQPFSRTGRTSTISQKSHVGSRASTQSASRHEENSRPAPPQWMYPGAAGLLEEPLPGPSRIVYQHTWGADENTTLRLSHWLEEVIAILQNTDDWEVYSYAVVHLPSQISNPTLFSNAIPHIKLLRNVIVDQLLSGKFRDPPANTGVKKADIALCLFNTLVMLIGYSEHFARTEQDDIVRTMLAGMGSWDRAARICIQGLSICCHQLPQSISRSLSAILQKMSQIITQSYLAMDILEFLAGLARLPDVYANLTEHELRTVFAICIRHLQHLRDQRQKQHSGSDQATHRTSGLSGESVSASASIHIIDVQKDLPQYCFALAYHVLTIWFLSLRLVDRPKHVGWITSNLASKDQDGNDVLDEQSQVTLDMMHRTAYLDLGETLPSTDFIPSDGKVLKKSWLLGMSIVTVETAAATGLSHLIKRQASGTTYALYQQHTADLPPHHVSASTDVMSSVHGPESRLNIFPNHVFLQLHSTIAPTPAPMEAICLPDDEATRRAVSAFDRNDTVDGYKVGVIYVSRGQSHEGQILANTRRSEAFDIFLEGLGTKIPLEGAVFNTQGLDKEYNTDGTHTYAWRDRITEIVFHVPTLMPTDLEHDPQCVNKKRHVGNDYVNIIFNESGSPWVFNTIPSQFNYVSIVITPEASAASGGEASDNTTGKDDQQNEANKPQKQLYYTIQTLVHPTFPQISPAASFKLLPLTRLPGLARQIALHAAVFSNVWANRDGGEHVSSWRNRLREIKKLRARFAGTGTSASERFPGAKGSKTYAEGDRFTGTVVMGGLAEEDGILSGLDFSRWAGPNPPLT